MVEGYCTYNLQFCFYNCFLLSRNGYYGHPGTHIDPGGGQWHEPVAGAGGEGGHVPREGSPGMGHGGHYTHLQPGQQAGQQAGMYPCKMQGGPPR